MRKFVNTVLAGALGLSMIAGVSAQNTATIEVGINEGEDAGVTAVITSAPNFGSVTYSLEDQVGIETTLTDLGLEVRDNRGGNTGWSVTIYGGDFIGQGDSSETFAVSNLTIGGGTVTSAQFGEAGNVTPTGSRAMQGSPGFRLLTATADAGSNGIFTIGYTGSLLTVPAGTPVDIYTSTLTVETSEAP